MISKRKISRFQENKVYVILDMNSNWEFVLSQIPFEMCSFVQLRDKSASDQQMLSWARDILKILPSKDKLIINDRVGIAQQLGLGVHLGMEDMKPDAARTIVGDDVPIGLTIHNQIELAQKYKEYIDYVGVGPIFPTQTKHDAKTVLGVSSLRLIRQKMKIPIVAIGGIDVQNCQEVWRTGVEQLAVCSAVMKAKDPRQAVLRLSNS